MTTSGELDPTAARNDSDLPTGAGSHGTAGPDDQPPGGPEHGPSPATGAAPLSNDRPPSDALEALSAEQIADVRERLRDRLTAARERADGGELPAAGVVGSLSDLVDAVMSSGWQPRAVLVGREAGVRGDVAELVSSWPPAGPVVAADLTWCAISDSAGTWSVVKLG